MTLIHKYFQKKHAYTTLIKAVILAVFLLFNSCSDDDEDFSQTGTNLSVSDISGNWIATKASFNNPSTDFLANEGSVTLSIQTNSRFTFTIKSPGEPDYISTGKVGFDGVWLAVRFDDDPGEEASFFISLINNILTLRGETELDVDGNGTEDFGILSLIMERS